MSDVTLQLEREDGTIEDVPLILEFDELTPEELALVYGYKLQNPPSDELTAFIVFLLICRDREWLVPEWPAVRPVLLSLVAGSPEHLIVENSDG